MCGAASSIRHATIPGCLGPKPMHTTTQLTDRASKRIG
jgi:hypothetical protein